eukprot:jgi/Bigna1/76746/fgenesh1_pg.43_\
MCTRSTMLRQGRHQIFFVIYQDIPVHILALNGWAVPTKTPFLRKPAISWIGRQVDVEVINPMRVNQAQRKTLAPEDVWTLKRRKTDTKFLLLVKKDRGKDKGGTDKSGGAGMGEQNWRKLITEYKQNVEIEQGMGNKVRYSISTVIRQTERRKRSALIRQEILSVKAPLTKLCSSIGRRWLNCSGAVRKRLLCEEEGICYRDYVNEDRKHITIAGASCRLSLRWSILYGVCVFMLGIRNKRSREAEDEKDVEKRVWFENMEHAYGGREECIKHCDDILVAFVQRNVALGYAQGLNYVVYFLLGFLDPESVFWLLCTMVENIRLPDFYAPVPSPLNGFQIEAKTLLEVAEITERKAIQSAATNNTKTSMDDSGSNPNTKTNKQRSPSNVSIRSGSIFAMLTGRKQELKQRLLEAEDENCERIGGELGVLYQKTTEWMIPMFLTVVALHPSIMIIDNFFDLYPDLEELYPDPNAASAEAKKQGKKTTEKVKYIESPTGEGPRAQRLHSIGSGEAVVYCTFLATMDLVKGRLENTEDMEARESFRYKKSEPGMSRTEFYRLLLTFPTLFPKGKMGRAKNDKKRLSAGASGHYPASASPNVFRQLSRSKSNGGGGGGQDRVVGRVDILQAIFDATDRDKGGFVSFKELVCTLAILCAHNTTSHLRLVFDAFDDTKSGYLNWRNLMEISRWLVERRFFNKEVEGADSKKATTAATASSQQEPRRSAGSKHIRGAEGTTKKSIEQLKNERRKDFRQMVQLLRGLDTSGNRKLSFPEFSNGIERTPILKRRIFEFKTSMKEARERIDFRVKVKKEQSQLNIQINSVQGVTGSGTVCCVMEVSELLAQRRAPIDKKKAAAAATAAGAGRGGGAGEKASKSKHSSTTRGAQNTATTPNAHKAGSSTATAGGNAAFPSLADSSSSAKKETVAAAASSGGTASSDRVEERPVMRATKRTKKHKVIWGPWETRYRSKGKNADVDDAMGTVEIGFRTNMTLEYGKSLDRLRVSVKRTHVHGKIKRRSGVVFVNEEECASGTYAFGALSKEVWENQEPFDISFPVQGPKVSGKVHMTFCYKKEWDEEVKRNKQALENIQVVRRHKKRGEIASLKHASALKTFGSRILRIMKDRLVF